MQKVKVQYWTALETVCVWLVTSKLSCRMRYPKNDHCQKKAVLLVQPTVETKINLISLRDQLPIWIFV
jgi:hypothetical protein